MNPSRCRGCKFLCRYGNLLCRTQDNWLDSAKFVRQIAWQKRVQKTLRFQENVNGDVELLVVEEIERMLSRGQASDPWRDLTRAEIEALSRGGVERNPARLELERDPFVRSAVEYGAMIATSFTVPEVAKMLRVDDSRIRQRLSSRTIYGIRLPSGWRIPRFQFDGERLLPGVDRVLPHLRKNLHPLELLHWFTTPSPDLVVGDDETPISP